MDKLNYPIDSSWIIKKKKSIKKQLLDIPGVQRIKKKIAVLGGSTTDNVVKIMELFLLYYGFEPEFYESEYNMYYQDSMYENASLKEFAPDIIYYHISSHNILSFPEITDDKTQIEEKLSTVFSHFKNMWDKVSAEYKCPIISNNFEPPSYRLLGNSDCYDIRGKVNFVNRLNLLMADYANEKPSFHINDINYQASVVGLDNWSDDFYWHMYKYSPAVPAIPYLALNVANIIKSIYGKNKKVLCLDLDNTLWGGVVGDDGADNIEIGQESSVGQSFMAFQKYVKELKSIGVVLSINSKNDYENAMSGLERPDSVLKKEDFASIYANWEPKDKNLSDIANELNLLTESFVFVDDNPAERAIVKESLPGVSVPPIERPEEYIKMIDRAGFFEVTSLSEDDLSRNKMYEENKERIRLERAYENYEDYLKSLEMKAEIKPFVSVYYDRIAQLSNKSNQFNLTTKRYDRVEIENFAKSDEYITLYGKLSDRFGDNGVVSVIIAKINGDSTDIILWIMSCRVLKRNMEYAMMKTLVSACKSQGIKNIKGFYYPTPKNGMVKNHYENMGFDLIFEDEEGNMTWEYIVDEEYNKNTDSIEIDF